MRVAEIAAVRQLGLGLETAIHLQHVQRGHRANNLLLQHVRRARHRHNGHQEVHLRAVAVRGAHAAHGAATIKLTS